MKCDGQHSIKLDKPKPDNRGGLIYFVPVNCGKCYNCKRNRVNQWSFRLMEELKTATDARFVTLTYDTKNVPITKNGFMTLLKTSKQDKEIKQLEGVEGVDRSIQGFIKRLRYYEKARNNASYTEHKRAMRVGALKNDQKLRFYAVGEYGSKRKRPHYHLIIFNLKSLESIQKAWPLGTFDIQEVNNNTIDYTLKYMMKESAVKRFKNLDSIKEFSIMSKGLGEQFLKKKRT